MTKEQKFYKALQDVFIGAKIEGKGGFINLMRIKSNYYRKIEDVLKKDIEATLKSHPEFRDELFDKLYSFFSRYFTESGSIYFSSTPFHNNIYEKVYTDEKDVILFWKTQMLYYVKTDRIFRSLEIESDGFKFFFDVSKLEHKKANEKRSLIFEFRKISEDGTIVFAVFYSEKGTKTKQDEILKAIKRNGVAITEEQLERAFRVFEKQSEVDFFINKNAKAFLQEQFKLWSYQYFWEGAKEWGADRVNELQILKDIAFKIIDFISQFEDELVKIWNKPKFVKNSNYVITLDRIYENSKVKSQNSKLLEKIFNHKGIKDQIKEWQELGIVDENFKIRDIFENDLTGKHLSKTYEHLPIDTKYFKDLELEILSLFDDLDKSLDGWLIKSENYQALNTILPKFKEKVQTIYIDPPYNTGSDDFIYNDKFKHASWLTMMENRLSLARELMKDDGVIFVSIDDNEVDNLNKLISEFFIKIENLKIKMRNPARQLTQRAIFQKSIEFCITASKSDKVSIKRKSIPYEFSEYKFKIIEKEGPNKTFEIGKYKIEEFLPHQYEIVECADIKEKYIVKPISIRGKIKTAQFTGKFYEENLRPIFDEKENYDVLYKVYGIGEDGFGFRYIKNPSVNTINGVYYQGIPLNVRSNIYEAQKEIAYFDFYDFEKEMNAESKKIRDMSLSSITSIKPVALIEFLLNMSSYKNGIILDFFAGSGTTAQAVMKLNKEDKGKRKFILVEMGDYFDTIILPRLKKTAYSFNWKNGKPQDADGIGVFFKYYELEQYEEALKNCVYEDSDLFTSSNKSPYEQYVFLKDEKMLRALEIDYENNKVKVDLDQLYPNIDIAETLSNLTGKWIKQVKSQNSKVKSVVFEDGTEIDVENLDYKLIKPLIWWE